MRLLVICFLLIILNKGGIAQPVRLSFQYFSQNEGLSDNLIHNFYQDSRGYLWISTNEGLNRFDGFTFKKYYSSNKQNTLQSNIVIQVLEHKPGYLLVGTSNGLSNLNMITGVFEKVSDSIVSTRSTNYIFKDNDGTIILCYGDGIAFLDSSLNIVEYIKTPASVYWPVITVHRLKTGELLVATTSGFFIADRKSRSLNPLSSNGKDSFPKYPMFSYYDSATNSLYTSEWNKGLYHIDLVSKKVKRYYFQPGCTNCPKSNVIYSVYIDRNRKLWIGSEVGILMIKKSDDKMLAVEDLKGSDTLGYNNMILEIFEDEGRNVWFGTPSGIRRLNHKAEDIKYYKEELEINGKGRYINDIIGIKENELGISTYGNGIFILNEKSKQIKNIGRSEMSFNWSISYSVDSIIATGHNPKMYSYHPKTGKVRLLDFLKPYYGNSNLLLFSFTHSSGDIWYSLNEGSGLVHYNKKTKKTSHYTKKDVPKPFSEGYFSIAEEDKEKNIWFAVNKSPRLTCWKYKTGSFDVVDFRTIGNNYNTLGGVSDIFINDTVIWIATGGGGIICYNVKKKTILTFTINDGLAGNVVNSLIMDGKNRLWAGTTKGLSCLLPGQKYFSSFGIAEGLPDIRFNERACYYDQQKNRLYFGVESSLLTIDPDELLNDKGLKIQAYLDGIKVNGESIDYFKKSSYVLNHNENNLQFTFSVVDLYSSSGISLYYQLAGADESWIHAEDQRTASYINLPAGKYELKLKVSKSGSDFTSSTVPFAFEIKQAWWKTIWFLTFVAIVLVIILYLIIRMYYRGKLEHQKMQFEKRQAVELERTRIATDMHDDLGAGLTGIKFLSENISEEEIPSSAREGLRKLKGSANKLIESMGEIIWAMNEKNNSLQDLIFHLRSYSLMYCEENMMNCSFRLPENIKELIITGHIRRNIFLIIKECLHNIVKHAAAQNVNIDVSSDDELVFRIQDNGKGFRPEQSRGNGLINMQKRAKEMGGNFHIADSGEGTVVTLRIPLR